MESVVGGIRVGEAIHTTTPAAHSFMAVSSSRRSARRRSFWKNIHLVTGSICFFVFFCHYWKYIVLTSNKIFESSSSIRGVDGDSDWGHDGNVGVRANAFAKHDTANAGSLAAKPIFHNKNNRNNNTSTISLPGATTNATDINTADTNTNGDTSNENTNVTKTDPVANNNLRFYILPSPDITTTLKRVHINRTASDLLAMASDYYRTALDEESAEMWLHRGFERLPARITKNPKDADVYIVVAYCHLFNGLLPQREDSRRQHQHQRRQLLTRHAGRKNKRGTKNRTAAKSSLPSSQSWADMIPKLYRNIVIDATKPHLILTPTWNPEVSRRIGLPSLMRTLQLRGVADSNLWSVGFERNLNWQPVPFVSRILPIPYVVRMMREANTKEEILKEKSIQYSPVENSTNTARKENSIFFVGDPRPNAEQWAGCSRSKLIKALQKQKTTNDNGVAVVVANNTMDNVRLAHKKNRLNQTTYQRLMRTTEYCLVLCGDTPTSRTLTAAVVEGCIPVRVGSRLRGLCDPPCHEGFGWNITGPENPHLPFEDKVPWDLFPEIDEMALLLNGSGGDVNGVGKGMMRKNNKPSTLVLQSMFQSYDTLEKKRLYAIMDRVRSGFIYGYGDPVLSQDFGDATSYVWDSFVAALQKKVKN